MNELYLTTETQGLWMSNNINAGSPTFSNVSSYPFRQPERIFFNPTNTNEMWVSSFGNGMKMGALTPNSIVDFTSENNWNVYPNPASSIVIVTASPDALISPDSYREQQFQLFNAYGQEVKIQNLVIGKNEINISNLPSGIYFLKIGNTAKKILISR